MTLCVADDEWYIGVEHDGIDLLVVPEIPSKALLLQSQKTRFLEDKLDLHVHLVQD